MSDIFKQFSDIICCPKCKGNVVQDGNKLICGVCSSCYTKNQHDIFNLLTEQVDIEVSSQDWDEYKWELLEKERAQGRMEKILKYIPKKGIHLDIGTGRGEGTLAVSKIKNTIGMDYGSKSLSIAKQYGLNLLQADGRYLPFKDNSFGSITALDVVEHIPNPILFLKEVHRILADDGIFLLQTPVTETEALKDKAKKIYKKYKLIQRIDNVANKIRLKVEKISVDTTNMKISNQPYDITLSEKQLLDLLKEAGFKIKKRKKINYFVSRLFIQLFSYSDLFVLQK